MKRFKFLLSLVVMAVLLSFTSCLDDGGDPQPLTLYGIVTVKEGSLGRFILKDNTGRLYNVVQNISGKDLSVMGRAIVIFNYMNENDWNDTSKESYDVKVLDATGIVDRVISTSRGSIADTLKSKCYFPIVDIEKGDSDNGSIIAHDGYMTLGVDYFLSGNVKHDFSLFRYPEDGVKMAAGGPDTLDVYLGHNNRGDKDVLQLIKYISPYNVSNWPLYFHAFQVSGMVPGGYSKDTLIMRVNYRKDTNRAERDTVNAFRLVKYPTK